MTKLAILSACFLLVACGADSTAEMKKRSEETTYSHSAIGYSATFTAEYESVLEKSRTNEGVKSFLRDVQSPDPAIRLYGLLGLKISGSDEYRHHLERLLLDDTPMRYGGGGCIIINNQPLSSIAKEIDETPVEVLSGRKY